LNDLWFHTFGDQATYGTKTFRDNLIVKNLNVYDELIRLGNAITTAFNTLTTNVNNTITNITNQIANKADKQSLTWITVPPANGWMTYPTEELQVAKDQFGMVYVRGTLNPTTAVNTSSSILGTMAILPAGYRPAKTFQYGVWQAGNMFGAININVDGSIEGYNPSNYPYPRFVLDHKIFSQS
jgi:hypothetical protein